MKTIAVILAGGIGTRYGSSIPKQFIKLNGIPAIYYSLNEYIKSNLFDKIIITISDLRFRYLFKTYDSHLIKVIKGGHNRTESVYNALKFIRRYKPENVVFQDAVRPLIKTEDLPQYIEALKDHDCVVTYEPITDALFDENRNNHKLILSPDAVKFDKLYKEINIHKPTDGIYQQLNNPKIKFIQLNHPNYKITYPYDLFILEHLLKYNEYNASIPDLHNKNILLLGVTGGIGNAVYNEIIKMKPDNLYCPNHNQLDLSKNFINILIPKYCYIDTIVNCTGIIHKNTNNLLNNYEELFNINFKANLQLIEYAKLLRTYHQRNINIVTISSSSATKGREGYTLYSASKSALHSLIESQSKELEKKKIFLNCICPEKVDTPIWKKINTKINSLEALNPSEVAKVILSYTTINEGGKIIHIKKGMLC